MAIENPPKSPVFSKIKTRGVSHYMALPFTFKSILRQTKNYENSNISPCEKKI
jgi:hypothetical protein